MTTWTELYYTRHLIARTYYGVVGVQAITVPAKAAIVRISLVGAGGAGAADGVTWGAGAAFARKKTTCTPGESFSLQVGDPAHTVGAGSSAGDSTCTRVTGSVLLAKAERGKSTGPGLAANSVGDVTRDGSAAPYTGPPYPNGAGYGGSAAGDDADPYPLGFGGRGAMAGGIWNAVRGGGGGLNINLPAPSGQTFTYRPGPGLICLEFFDQDPGY